MSEQDMHERNEVLAPVTSMDGRKRILLGQLGARGDCLYATAIARQIKQDFPGCHLTWAIGSMARSILIGNPHVDAIWELPAASHAEIPAAWQQLEQLATQAKARGEFDEIYLTQIYPNNFQNYDGTVRASIFRAYPRPITVPVEPVLYLTEIEIANVRAFAEQHGLSACSKVVMFEFSSHSGQSFVNFDFVVQFANAMVAADPDVRIVLTSNLAIQSQHPRVIDGSKLSFRENAELTKYCALLLGVSSGVSWLCTSNWAKKIPMVQLLNKHSSVYASFVHDYEYRGADASHIIEMTNCAAEQLVQCVCAIFQQGVASARARFHETIALNFDAYFGVMAALLKDGRHDKVITSAGHTLKRYGYHDGFVRYLNQLLTQAVTERMHGATNTVMPVATAMPAVATTPIANAASAAAPDAQTLAALRQLQIQQLQHSRAQEQSQLLQGRMAAWQLMQRKKIATLADAEFQVFSQWGEDGIIEWLVQNLPIEHKTFIEFGVETYKEANTRFLLENRNWSGLILDGSAANIQAVHNTDLYWRQQLRAVAAFITRDNINHLLSDNGMKGDIGLLSVDIDGNDYWVWEAIDVVSPRIVVCEYNAILGDKHAITIPYEPAFTRFKAHHSGLYFGASIAALILLGKRKGYRFVGSNANGVNAFFVREDLFGFIEPLLSECKAFPSGHRDSRDTQGHLSFAAGAERFELIKAMPVLQVETGSTCQLSDLTPVYSEQWLQEMQQS